MIGEPYDVLALVDVQWVQRNLKLDHAIIVGRTFCAPFTYDVQDKVLGTIYPNVPGEFITVRLP